MTAQEKITRITFLKNLGLKGAALMAVYCTGQSLTACQNDSAIDPLGADVVLDLTDSKYAALNATNGYVVLGSQNIVVARTSSGQYVAVTLICSHEHEREVIFKAGEFYCTAHGARFDSAGKGLNSEGKKGLTTYPTSLSGTTLTILAA